MQVDGTGPMGSKHISGDKVWNGQCCRSLLCSQDAQMGCAVGRRMKHGARCSQELDQLSEIPSFSAEVTLHLTAGPSGT